MVAIRCILVLWCLFCCFVRVNAGDATERICSTEGVVDLIIFSKDRPLFLEGLLSSIASYMTGLRTITVICHASHESYERAYEKVWQQFPCVQPVMQDRVYPRKDFDRLLRAVFAATSGDYIMFSVDDIFVLYPVSMSRSAELLEETGAYGMYLRLGSHITHCYMSRSVVGLPVLESVADDVVSWRLAGSGGDWGWYHSLDMTLYRRSTVAFFLNTHRAIVSPNIFEGTWSGVAIERTARGICYTVSPIINCVVNMVQTDYCSNRCAHFYSIQELLDLFEDGYRIDIERLRSCERHAPHVEVQLPLCKKLDN